MFKVCTTTSVYYLFVKHETGSISEPGRRGIISFQPVFFAHTGFHGRKIQVRGLRGVQQSSEKCA